MPCLFIRESVPPVDSDVTHLFVNCVGNRIIDQSKCIHYTSLLKHRTGADHVDNSHQNLSSSTKRSTNVVGTTSRLFGSRDVETYKAMVSTSQK